MPSKDRTRTPEQKAARKAYDNENREAKRASARKWRKENPEYTRAKERERKRKWRRKYPEKHAEKKRAHKERFKARDPEGYFEKFIMKKRVDRAKLKAENPYAYSMHVKARRLKALYGMTLHEFHKAGFEQGFACVVCRERVQLVVDHDHKTGLVRGLICGPCNSALGAARDNPQTLRRLADYLDTHALLT